VASCWSRQRKEPCRDAGLWPGRAGVGQLRALRSSGWTVGGVREHGPVGHATDATWTWGRRVGDKGEFIISFCANRRRILRRRAGVSCQGSRLGELRRAAEGGEQRRWEQEG
jgi:hypothetical protein